jgi:hypothetical protein
MLFLKRTSDQFDIAQEEVRKRGKALKLTDDQIKEMTENPRAPEVDQVARGKRRDRLAYARLRQVLDDDDDGAKDVPGS